MFEPQAYIGVQPTEPVSTVPVSGACACGCSGGAGAGAGSGSKS
jgi:hypothetical protein